MDIYRICKILSHLHFFILCFNARIRNSVHWLLIWQDDDAVNAEAFINKASFLVSNSHNEALNWTYKVDTV